jgi:putative FmdB family regulatory protein
MPIYEYECMDCKKTFSLLQSVSASEEDTECSHCGSGNVRKKISLFACSTAGNSAPSALATPLPSGGG